MSTEDIAAAINAHDMRDDIGPQTQSIEMQRRLLAKTKTDKTNILLKKSKYIVNFN